MGVRGRGRLVNQPERSIFGSTPGSRSVFPALSFAWWPLTQLLTQNKHQMTQLLTQNKHQMTNTESNLRPVLADFPALSFACPMAIDTDTTDTKQMTNREISREVNLHQQSGSVTARCLTRRRSGLRNWPE